jgi:hypothetical protein
MSGVAAHGWPDDRWPALQLAWRRDRVGRQSPRPQVSRPYQRKARAFAEEYALETPARELGGRGCKRRRHRRRRRGGGRSALGGCGDKPVGHPTADAELDAERRPVRDARERDAHRRRMPVVGPLAAPPARMRRPAAALACAPARSRWTFLCEEVWGLGLGDVHFEAWWRRSRSGLGLRLDVHRTHRLLLGLSTERISSSLSSSSSMTVSVPSCSSSSRCAVCHASPPLAASARAGELVRIAVRSYASAVVRSWLVASSLCHQVVPSGKSFAASSYPGRASAEYRLDSTAHEMSVTRADDHRSAYHRSWYRLFAC